MASTAKAPSVKSVCEDNILKGRKMGVVMNNLRKKFSDKDDATLEKSVKYYASALCRDGKITEEDKALYVGARGKPAATAKAGKAKGSKTAKAEKPAKATRGKKASGAAKADKPAKSGKKASARSKAKKS